jgi:hypothetical protein
VIAAVRTVRIGAGHAHELLEMALAAHADVFVDRHLENPTKRASSRLVRTEQRDEAVRRRFPPPEDVVTARRLLVADQDVEEHSLAVDLDTLRAGRL